MGRVYHPKERLKYLPEDVSAALAHVKRGMSIRKTARRFGFFMSNRLGLS